MNLDQLEYFRRVARLQHVSRAADDLGITQPALSRAIGRLERELGVPLFRRDGRSIALTPFGAAFLARSERALDEVDAGRREVADLYGERTGRVALGFLRTLGARFVPETVRDFLRIHAHVEFVFTQNNSAVLEAQVLSRDIGLCLTARRPAQTALAWQAVTTQQFVAIVPPHHRLARRRTIAIADLRDEPFISFKAGHAVRTFTDGLCRRAGFVPAVAFEADESSSIRGFVRAGFGVALVPETGGADELPGIPLADRATGREIGVSWLADRYLSAAECAFRDFIAQAQPAG